MTVEVAEKGNDEDEDSGDGDGVVEMEGWWGGSMMERWQGSATNMPCISFSCEEGEDASQTSSLLASIYH